MPSKDEFCFLTQAKKRTNYAPRDLDELVYQIEQLRVKAKAPSQTTCIEKNRLRASPYSIPSRGSKCGCCDSRRCMHRNNSSTTTVAVMRHNNSHSRPHTDDPYEALQELLRDGDLIKEAVRRLNISCFRPKDKSTIVFYDSDDERTPYPFNVEM